MRVAEFLREGARRDGRQRQRDNDWCNPPKAGAAVHRQLEPLGEGVGGQEKRFKQFNRIGREMAIRPKPSPTLLSFPKFGADPYWPDAAGAPQNSIIGGDIAGCCATGRMLTTAARNRRRQCWIPLSYVAIACCASSSAPINKVVTGVRTAAPTVGQYLRNRGRSLKIEALDNLAHKISKHISLYAMRRSVYFLCGTEIVEISKAESGT
jgi:hypothetical protein